MDLIEVLWKQDVDLGFTLVDPLTAKNPATSSKKESEDDIEKLKALEAINAADDKVSSTSFMLITVTHDPFYFLSNTNYPLCVTSAWRIFIAPLQN